MKGFVVTISLTAYSKGRPSGFWARVLPKWAHGWFTWGRTPIGTMERTARFPRPNIGDLTVVEGELKTVLDREMKGLQIFVANIPLSYTDFPLVGGARIEVKQSLTGGFDVEGWVIVEEIS